MLRFVSSAILVTVVISAGLSPPAYADVIYDLTFHDGATNLGTGILDLNFTSLSQADSVNESLNGILVSLTTPNLDGTGTYTVTPSNLAAGSNISTGPAGEIYSLTLFEKPGSDQNGTGSYVWLAPIIWTLFGNYYSYEHGGYWTIGGPQLSTDPVDPPGPNGPLAPVPEPLTLWVFGAGLAAAVALRRRDKASLVPSV